MGQNQALKALYTHGGESHEGIEWSTVEHETHIHTSSSSCVSLCDGRGSGLEKQVVAVSISDQQGVM